MKALYLTHEGISNSIFRSQVVEHCSHFEKNGVLFDILVYSGYPKLREISKINKKRYSGLIKGQIILKSGLSILIFLAPLYYMISLVLFLNKRREYRFIHARTDFSAFVAISTRFLHGLPVLWDCRGDSFDEMQNTLITKPFIFRWIGIYLLLRQRLFVVFNNKFADAIVVVSESLKVHLAIEETKVITVPCSVPEAYFAFSEEERHTVRKELCLKPEDLLFVYSGSMIGYQAIERLIEFGVMIQDLGHYLLILTKDVDKFGQEYRGQFPASGIFVKSVGYEAMSKYYSAADFGILLRDDTSTNRVASPTKFGEYCMTGLKVIHNSTIDQVTRITDELGNGTVIDEKSFQPYSHAERLSVSIKAKEYFGRNSSTKTYLGIYRNLENKRANF